MANTSSRTLRLLSLLQAHRYWPGEELARRLEVSERTLRRDVDRLRDLGYPVEAHRGVDGGYQLGAGAALPPLLLDGDEAVALAVGLLTSAHSAVSGVEESSVRALTKVVQVMPPALRRRVNALQAVTIPAVWGPGSAGQTSSVDPAVLTAAAQACRDEERLRFSYTAQRGEQSHRNVEPLRLVSLGRRWYLVAFDLTREAWRTFRLDRIRDPLNTGHTFRPRALPAPDAATFVRSSMESLATTYAVEAIVHAPEARVRSVVGHWATLEPLDEQRTRLRMTVDSLDWPALALGAIRADFEILSPPELTAHLAEWSTRFSRATASVSPTAG
jgi:predicted DNA-binding transcriptional regulator YafY